MHPARGALAALVLTLVYLLFATGQLNGQCESTTQYPRRGKEALEIAFAAYESTYCNLKINLTENQLVKLSACEDLLAGKPVAALKRICLRSRTKNFENDRIALRTMWCEDMAYREKVQKCIQFKLRSMPGAPGFTRERGTISSGWRTIDCFNRTLNFYYSVP